MLHRLRSIPSGKEGERIPISGRYEQPFSALSFTLRTLSDGRSFFSCLLLFQMQNTISGGRGDVIIVKRRKIVLESAGEVIKIEVYVLRDFRVELGLGSGANLSSSTSPGNEDKFLMSRRS